MCVKCQEMKNASDVVKPEPMRVKAEHPADDDVPAMHDEYEILSSGDEDLASTGKRAAVAWNLYTHVHIYVKKQMHCP